MDIVLHEAERLIPRSAASCSFSTTRAACDGAYRDEGTATIPRRPDRLSHSPPCAHLRHRKAVIIATRRRCTLDQALGCVQGAKLDGRAAGVKAHVIASQRAKLTRMPFRPVMRLALALASQVANAIHNAPLPGERERVQRTRCSTTSAGISFLDLNSVLEIVYHSCAT